MAIPALQVGLLRGLNLFEIVLVLTALPFAFIIYWDASKREVPHKIAWAGGTILSGLAPLVGYTIVSLLYFVINRGHGQRVASTGYLLVAWGLLQGGVVFPYALGPAQDPFGGIVTVLPTVIILAVWYFLG